MCVLGLEPTAQRVQSPTGYFKLFLLFNYIKARKKKLLTPINGVILDMQMSLHHFLEAHICVQIKKPLKYLQIFCKYLVISPIYCTAGKNHFRSLFA